MYNDNILSWLGFKFSKMRFQLIVAESVQFKEIKSYMRSLVEKKSEEILHTKPYHKVLLYFNRAENTIQRSMKFIVKIYDAGFHFKTTFFNIKIVFS